MTKNIPLSIPNLKGNELKYVSNAIETEWVSSGGPYVGQFEKNIAKYVNSKDAVSCQNGTAGLHIALQLCNVLRNDEVIVPTLTFIAAVNPVKYIGAEPVFMDCNDDLSIDPVKLDDFCQHECIYKDNKLINKKTKRQIKAIIVVHVFGNMSDMEKIMRIANLYKLKVIEDSTEALGTYYISGAYKGRYAGTIGDVGVYSFNGNKIITTGGGGMIVSNDLNLISRAKHLTTQAKIDELYYIHDEIGFNYRMTNLQAALGIAQLEQLEAFIKIKKENYELYKTEINKISGLNILDFNKNTRPNYWFYALYVEPNYCFNRDDLIKHLSSKGIQTRPIWGLINDQKPYLNNQSYKILKAKQYLSNVVNIPCSSSLTKEDVDYVISYLK
jgi:aminotransferase in exopolysaccharide biosynthesis